MRGALLLPLFATATMTAGQAQRAERPPIPKTWDDDDMASVEIPLAETGATPVHVPSEYYYKIPVRPIFKSYPVYGPGKEPPGYLEQLAEQEPALVFREPRLLGEDWVRAGEIVFDAPITYDIIATVSEVRDPTWYARTGVLLAKDGTLPYVRYVVREKGKVELGNLACGMCHTRVMPDGTVIKGAQGNFAFEQAWGYAVRTRVPKEVVGPVERALFATPWLSPDPGVRLAQAPLDEIAAAHEAIPPGVLGRQRSSVERPPRIPDLIGVKERRYLDASGLARHRNIGDLMRYAALNQGGDDLALYGTYRPITEFFEGKVPVPEKLDRYADEELYALALYLYSLTPPLNPHPFDAVAARGKQVFEKGGCGACHTPPLYTNNMLLPADGFTVPAEHRAKYDVLPFSVGTDSTLTLKTRRGTGYYKVPSLKGLWYRGPLEHNGSVAALEDWFNPHRLDEGYEPTGFRGGPGVKSRPVRGHPFGLEFSADDRKALIAFLKTL